MQAPPIIVVAPWRRCGTTLVQRALNSTREALIYGENFNLLENYPIIVAGVHSNIELKTARTATVRSQVLSGNEDVDASAMFPDYAGYASLIRAHFYTMVRYYAESTSSLGRERWGIKHQIRRVNGFAAFRRMLPNARYVFVYRDIIDIARSDKARFPGEYASPQRFAELGRIWRRNEAFLRSINEPHVLHLEFREFAADPSQVIEKLQSHCGVSRVDPAVFQRRINVSSAIDRLQGDERITHYRRPSELTITEMNALQRTLNEAGAQVAAIPARDSAPE
jgi:hypothetical protein